MQNRIIKNIMLLAFSMAVFVAVSADVEAAKFVKYGFVNGTIVADGTVHITTNPVTDVNIIGFACTSANCTSAPAQAVDFSTGTLVPAGSPPVLGSGANDFSILKFPTGDSSVSTFGYGIYIYKDGFIPWEQNSKIWGTNSSGPGNSSSNPIITMPKALTKMEACSAPIVNFTVVNDADVNLPVIVDVQANFSADAAAAIRNSGPLNFIPPTLVDKYYSVDTRINLVIKNSTGDVVETNTTNVLIPYSGSRHVLFTFTPTKADTYTATVTTGISDAKCLQDSVKSETQGKTFKVWPAAPRDACYAILNTLSYSPLYPKAGQNIEFTFNKIANYANDFPARDPNYKLTPASVRATYIIKNSTNQEVFKQELASLPANPNSETPVSHSFSAPLDNGTYSVSVEAVTSDDILCTTFTKDKIDTTLTVLPNITDAIAPDITITYPANSQSFTDANITVNGTSSDNVGVGKVEVKIGTGDWQNATGTISWSANATLASGSNVIYARATDISGNSKEVSVAVAYGTADQATQPAEQPGNSVGGSGSSNSGGGSGSSGGIGSIGVSGSMLKNPNAVLSGLAIPDTIMLGDNLTVSGCAVNLDENSTIILGLDNVLKDTAKVSAPSTCFKLSGGAPAFGKHVVSVLLKDSKANFSKNIQVTNPKDVMITGFSVPDGIIAGVPATINISVNVLKPENVTMSLDLDNITIGSASAFVNGTYAFQFNYTFLQAGNRTVTAKASTKNSTDTMAKQIEIRAPAGGPTGSFLASALESGWTHAIILISVLSGVGYYLYRKGYFSRLRTGVS